MSSELETARLRLVPITPEMVEAILLGQRDRAASLIDAALPDAWPNRALVERAFCARLDDIRAAPHHRLWGDRVALTKTPPYKVVGSVVFHGGPDADGAVEVAYGIEEESQRKGYGFEAVEASVRWAREQRGVRVVRAATFTWHASSRRILEKLGFQPTGSREELLGEMLEYALPVDRA